MRMTPSTTTREAPTMEGGGRPTRTAQRAERETEGKIPENGVIPATQKPRLNRVLRTPIEVGRAIQGDSPATNKNGLIAGSKRKRAPTKGN